MTLDVETELEADGRWIADVPALPACWLTARRETRQSARPGRWLSSCWPSGLTADDMRLIQRLARHVLVTATCLLLAATAVAGGRRFDFHAEAEYSGLSPFQHPDRPVGGTLRLYPGEPVEVLLTGSILDATPVPPCEVLVAGMEPLLIPGNLDAVITGGAALPLAVSSITWSISPEADCCQRHACARAVSSPVTLPAGEYTFVAVMHDPKLVAAFGASAVYELRTTTVRVIAGPPTDPADEMWMHLKAGRRAFAAKQWSDAEASAEAVLAIHPHSVLAMVLRAEVLRQLGNEPAAMTVFATALSSLESGRDDATHLFDSPSIKEEYLNYLKSELVPDDDEP